MNPHACTILRGCLYLAARRAWRTNATHADVNTPLGGAKLSDREMVVREEEMVLMERQVQVLVTRTVYSPVPSATNGMLMSPVMLMVGTVACSLWVPVPAANPVPNKVRRSSSL